MTIGTKQINSNTVYLAIISVLMSITSFFLILSFNEFKELNINFIKAEKENAVGHTALISKIDNVLVLQGILTSTVDDNTTRSIDNGNRLTRVEGKVGLY
jgi:hypothetical protein